MKTLLPTLCLILTLFSCHSQKQTKKENKQPTNTDKTLMAIFAHPDDEIVISPILSKYAKEGASIHLVIVTDGSKGVTPHANIPAGDLLANVRAQEALCVTKTLGINPPTFLNYTDGDLALNENLFSLDDKIDSLFTKHEPEVVITFGPGGEYGHSDHRMVSNIVTEVFQREASETQQLLYYGFPNESKNKELSLKTDLVKWFNENLKTTRKRFLTYRIPFSEEDLKLGHEASSCHTSQYTAEAIDDLFTMMKQTDSVIYFRPWNGSKAIKEHFFD
ncbi:PIG-L deacetylase family protein [Zobellia nedashkovskayae]|uniref:PIG-L deacetylase family protein n=1 Tax=Zobellia nedashkovskayae TaxID=2779510 RepID=UPI00188BBA26|nr:PIG-L family deacetylase [Zobellia nedashkovskayae]